MKHDDGDLQLEDDDEDEDDEEDEDDDDLLDDDGILASIIACDSPLSSSLLPNPNPNPNPNSNSNPNPNPNPNPNENVNLGNSDLQITEVLVNPYKNEKRLSRYRSAPSKALMERMEVALTSRMYLIHRYPILETDALTRRYTVLGTTGSTYTICISNLPSCNCPDSAKGHHCCHILFIFLKVLKVAQTDPILYQRALLSSELKSLYQNAPQDPVNVTELPLVGVVPFRKTT